MTGHLLVLRIQRPRRPSFFPQLHVWVPVGMEQDRKTEIISTERNRGLPKAGTVTQQTEPCTEAVVAQIVKPLTQESEFSPISYRHLPRALPKSPQLESSRATLQLHLHGSVSSWARWRTEVHGFSTQPCRLGTCWKRPICLQLQHSIEGSLNQVCSSTTGRRKL